MRNDDSMVAKVAAEILEYARCNPRVEDTIDGVSQWWLSSSQIEYPQSLVSAALDRLVTEGRAMRRASTNGICLYSLRPSHD